MPDITMHVVRYQVHEASVLFGASLSEPRIHEAQDSVLYMYIYIHNIYNYYFIYIYIYIYILVCMFVGSYLVIYIDR